MTAESKSELQQLTEAIEKLAETRNKIADSVLTMAQNQAYANEAIHALFSRLEVIAMATGTNLTGRFAYRN